MVSIQRRPRHPELVVTRPIGVAGGVAHSQPVAQGSRLKFANGSGRREASLEGSGCRKGASALEALREVQS